MSAPENDSASEEGNWLKRRPKLERSGDVIIARIGAGASRIAVGKNIVQIGTLELPTLPVVLTLVITFGLAAGFLWFELVPAEMPISPLNIAVAEIGLEDAGGNVASADDGQRLGEWIYSELQTGYLNLPTGRPVVWHDSMGLLEKRSKIGLVEGDTQSEKTAAAEALAQRISANMVIYGLLSDSGNLATFAPQFYVAATQDQADELVGPHQLGQPIDISLPLDPSDLRTSEYLRSELGPRIEALVWLTRAIVLDLNGQHADALDVLGRAESELEDWNDDHGKEILHYFIGREALYLSRDDPSWLEDAERAYVQALEINPDYARAHIGLGGVYHGLAQRQALDARLETDALDLALYHYQQAIEKADRSPGSFIELKGRLGLGFTWRLLGEAFLFASNFEAAAAALEESIRMLESALPEIREPDHRLSSEAHLALGAAYQRRAQLSSEQNDSEAARMFLERAEVAYSNCIQQAEADLYDSSSQEQRTTGCEPNRLEVLRILEELEAQG